MAYSAALHHAGATAQNDRIALNKSHEQFKELQIRYVACKHNLDSESQQHQVCQESLRHECIRHQETEKNLNCVWNANNRLAELVSQVHFQADGKPDTPLDVTSLVIEVEAKATKIADLEQAIEALQEDNKSSLLALNEKYDREMLSKCRVIAELEALLSGNKPKRTRGKSNKRGGKRQKRKAWHSSTVTE